MANDADLNRCLIYGNPDGTFLGKQKRYSVIDGKLLWKELVRCKEIQRNGVYISGEDPASVDTVATTLMGFDWRKLPVVWGGQSMKCLYSKLTHKL